MKFDKKQLERWIDTELGLLRYYGFREDRCLLNENSDIYKDVRSIGYTKRPMELSLRCVPATITSDSPITSQTKIEDLYLVYTRNQENTFTPVETFIKLFPQRKMEIINILTSQESNPSTTIHI